LKLKYILLLMVSVLFVTMLVACGSSKEELPSPKASTGKVAAEELSEEEMDKKDVEKDKKKKSNDKKKDSKDNGTKKDQSSDKDKKTNTKSNDSSKKETKDDTKKSSNDINVSEASGVFYVVNTSGLNVRSGDSTSYAIIGALNQNDKINVTGKTSNGWYQFDYNGKKGYVSGNYLSTEKQDTNTASSSKGSNEKSNKNTGSSNNGNSNKGNGNKGSSSDNQNAVDKMKNLGKSQQVILVTTSGYNTSTGKISTYEKDGNGKWNLVLSSTAYIGKNGFTDNKAEGDGKSPTGKYTIGQAFGYEGNPGTKLSFKNSTENDVWVDDSNSKYYNTWQKDDKADKDWDSAESMMHRLYNYGFVINYNTAQTPGKGSAIFMHVGSSYTLGCTATNQGDLIKIMQWVDPSKNPVIIQTPESGLGNY